MSRYYRLFVTSTGITKEQIFNVCLEEFGWDEGTSSWKSKTTFDGEGFLCERLSVDEAHKKIYYALKKINPEAKIKTKWIDMDDLPCHEYGDNID